MEVRWSGVGPAACVDPTAHTKSFHDFVVMVRRISLTSKMVVPKKKAPRSKTDILEDV